MDEHPYLGVIGGSGLYDMPGLVEKRTIQLETQFGKPSGPVLVGSLGNLPVAFLARHGIGHSILPSEINYRANILALKSLGVRRIISISAVGSLREDFAPGQIIIPDQLFDFTRLRKSSFFGDGLAGHLSTPEPFCKDLSEQLAIATTAAGAQVHRGGTLITIEGPRFSTRAESNVFRAWGMSLIGMTTSPEAFLAREAEMCYAVMAHVTDYDVWHISEEPVTVNRVVEILHQNTQVAQQAIVKLTTQLQVSQACTCFTALANAIITNPGFVPEETRRKLELVTGKYLP